MSSERRNRDQDEPANENEAKEAALSHEAYTVGWVCALPKEQTAAIAMLDQRHPNIPNMQPPTDTNAYTLGSIGGHNIVIACLPRGQIGVVSAATVATNMVSTFPTIKIGLMVGIGGGVPSNKVRLGDIVVSSPIGTHPGVVQWDLGKAKEGGNFERTGSLNNPPTFLLTALTKLETTHEMEGSKIDKYLEELGRKFPKLVSKYLRSEALRDVLFKADCAHVDKDDSSSSSDDDEDDEPDACRFCDKTKAKERRLRDTRVHCGLIASGNQVIKDAVFRDKLNQDLGGNVLCVEMEAAGLMATFPCLVIRGICDYADSHKNKDWQEHAAAVAAALAKELLVHIEPQIIEKEAPAMNLLRDTITKSSFENMQSRLSNKEDLEILEWLTPFSSGSQQSDFLSRHHPGTGKWFLDSKPFQDWVAEQGKTLFCPGIPGSGKTIMAALAIDYIGQHCIKDEKSVLSFIYCSYKRHSEQKLPQLLAGILKQVSHSQGVLPESVKKLHQKHTEKHEPTRPSVHELMDITTKLVASSHRTYIVVDALDECSRKDECQSSLIAYLRRLQEKTNASIMFTSRHTTQLDVEFDGCLRQDIRASDQDVYSYTVARLPKVLRSISQTPDLHCAVQSKIMGLVDGMFLLAQLYLNVISDQTSAFEVRQVLATIEASANSTDRVKLLNRAYDQAIERIRCQPPRFCDLGIKTLAWIVFAERPLSTDDLRHALAVKLGDNRLDIDNLRQIEVIMSVCAGLVTVDEKSNVIRLAHFTTQEYLVSLQTQLFPNVHDEIATSCVTYLRFYTFGNLAHPAIEKDEQELSENHPPFIHYAAENWGHHARRALKLPKSVIAFIADETSVSFAYKLAAKVGTMRLPSPQEEDWTGLHAAAFFDLVEAGESLIEAGCDVNRQASPHYTSPLYIASALGFEKMATLLLDNKADINAQCHLSYTPLMIAVIVHNVEMVQLLLDRGADTGFFDDAGGWTALDLANNELRSEMARLLRQAGAPTNTRWAFYPKRPLNGFPRRKGHVAEDELQRNKRKHAEDKYI
ncbi:hypothetical protein GCG54_00000674 [Colletotrichum gloeosporioides]|uniref:Nucleoside phosphorylase domain-containing protein n=1 Tax=Colletotrichum gloeosporioides TaxID=474922 RepID=A0A8H4CIE4_COLGL|nr:uncharacterized protein GCG54_00000674 [Colletotrichum gloeosporioides]KAF3804322.1 hypothetical protein GCG54_00000674 [Colletotrichum gloeosporioides]